MSSEIGPAALSDALERRTAALDCAQLRSEFERQGEFIAIENFLPEELLKSMLATLPLLEPQVHRNFIPGHKKGGSISCYDLDQHAPLFGAFYRLPAFKQLLAELTQEKLQYCPPNDPHTYALYYYTEPGDHIGFHYDTSYYKGKRYTILLGLVDDSSCELEYELFRDQPDRDSVQGSMALAPGTLVVFNGDRLWHRITPAGPNERRIALTLEFLTSLEMHPLRRFVSNMKDAIAYFGFRQVFSGAAARRDNHSRPN